MKCGTAVFLALSFSGLFFVYGRSCLSFLKRSKDANLSSETKNFDWVASGLISKMSWETLSTRLRDSF